MNNSCTGLTVAEKRFKLAASKKRVSSKYILGRNISWKGILKNTEQKSEIGCSQNKKTDGFISLITFLVSEI